MGEDHVRGMSSEQVLSQLHHHPESVALHLLEATQAAAIACVGWVGRGDRKGADGAAVAAMRDAMREMPVRARVAIGEGEKDQAPMLYIGEELGFGTGVQIELAVDPLEGTNYCAQGLDGAISVVAAAPPGALWSTRATYYIDKLIVGHRAAGAIDITAPVTTNMRRIAGALGKKVGELVAVVLDKPRHRDLIQQLRAEGISVVAITDGDVMGALRVLLPQGGIDVALGVGGAPEGVITACAARLLGGDMQARPAPQTDDERVRMEAEGVDAGQVLNLHDLVSSTACAFVATAVTASPPLAPPISTTSGWRLSSMVMTPRHRSLLIEAVSADTATR